MNIYQTTLILLHLLAYTLSGLDMIVYYGNFALDSDDVTRINEMMSAVSATLTWNNVPNVDSFRLSSQTTFQTALADPNFNADLLLVDGKYNNNIPIWSTQTETAIIAAIAAGKIKKISIWDWYIYSRGASNNIPDISNLFVMDYSYTICPVIEGVPPSTGPRPEVGCWDGGYGAHASVACANLASLQVTHPEAVAYYKENDNGMATHIQYCYNGADIMYSTTPMSVYWIPSVFPNWNGPKALDYFINSIDLLLTGTVCDLGPCADYGRVNEKDCACRDNCKGKKCAAAKGGGRLCLGTSVCCCSDPSEGQCEADEAPWADEESDSEAARAGVFDKQSGSNSFGKQERASSVIAIPQRYIAPAIILCATVFVGIILCVGIVGYKYYKNKNESDKVLRQLEEVNNDSIDSKDTNSECNQSKSVDAEMCETPAKLSNTAEIKSEV